MHMCTIYLLALMKQWTENIIYQFEHGIVQPMTVQYTYTLQIKEAVCNLCYIWTNWATYKM